MDKVEVYKDEAGEYRWRRKGPNGEKVSDSSEGYRSHIYTKERAAKLNPDCLIVDLVTEGDGGEGEEN